VSFARILDRLTARTSQPQPKYRQDPLRLATAAILLDIAYADGTFTAAEDGDVIGYLTKRFELEEDDARELMSAADEIRAKTIDHFALTNYIRQKTSLEDRIEIVKTMWRMAWSDGRLTDMEGYLVRKIAGLLGLEHHVMIDAKSAVMRELGIEAK
jgi:uncharacterized tellurite resistance protein B-like protein